MNTEKKLQLNKRKRGTDMGALQIDDVMESEREEEYEIITSAEDLDRAVTGLGSDGYRIIGNYRVKESFEGDEQLSDLLTDYLERIASLRY